MSGILVSSTNCQKFISCPNPAENTLKADNEDKSKNTIIMVNNKALMAENNTDVDTLVDSIISEIEQQGLIDIAKDDKNGIQTRNLKEFKLVPDFLLESNNHHQLQEKYPALQQIVEQQTLIDIAQKNAKESINTEKQINGELSVKEVSLLKNFIKQQIERPVLQQAVKQQISELKNRGKLHAEPKEPSYIAMNFIRNSDGRLTLHQTVEYNEYLSKEKNNDTKTHKTVVDEKPFVRVDYCLYLTEKGELAKVSPLGIEFNHSGENLKPVFDQRSLWLKICDYFSHLFSSKNSFEKIKETAPEISKNNSVIKEFSLQLTVTENELQQERTNKKNEMEYIYKEMMNTHDILTQTTKKLSKARSELQQREADIKQTVEYINHLKRKIEEKDKLMDEYIQLSKKTL